MRTVNLCCEKQRVPKLVPKLAWESQRACRINPRSALTKLELCCAAQVGIRVAALLPYMFADSGRRGAYGCFCAYTLQQ